MMRRKRLANKIRVLSRLLKLLCRMGIVLFPILTIFYWIKGVSQIQVLGSNWYLFFLDTSLISLNELPLKSKMLGILVDFIPCVFFISILLVMSRLFGQYERLVFFTKGNIRSIRWIAVLLFSKMLIYPFYLALRSYLFVPGEKHVLILFGPNEFKSFIVILFFVLIAYLMEVAFYLEEEIKTTI